MPANLTPQYMAAEERYKSAKDDRERLKALKEMLAMIPKHKGTEKLQADIKRKIARIRDELEVKKSKGGHRFNFSVEREGAAQVMVVGTPNVGKSSLINALTGANLEVGDYPFTTRIFHPAMMPVKDIQVQLEPLDDAHWVSIRTFFVGNKADLPNAPENFQVIEELFGERFEIIPVSAKNKTNLDSIRLAVMETLHIIRVYSKRPGHEPEMEKPFTFRSGETLMDFAKAVHKDFAKNLKFARVWGKDVFDGQRINKDYILQDGDVIELHL
ncbi:hypothetical protein B6D60_11990 [candidate division KSB1 bacterium 4484_87]|nr:MAG: hypothetical protein B6D60_11990 [candidate division KSB1 bacterium 4484_87]